MVLCRPDPTFGSIGLLGERIDVAKGLLLLGFITTLTGYVTITTKVLQAKRLSTLPVAAGGGCRDDGAISAAALKRPGRD